MEAGLPARAVDRAGAPSGSPRDSIADTFGPGPGARADGPFRAATSTRSVSKIDGSFLAFAQRSPVEAIAAELAMLGHVVRPLALPIGDEIPFFKRAQIAAADLALQGLADPQGPRAADAVRRQPRPPRAGHRRRARVRRRPGRPHRRRHADRARRARGGRDPRLPPCTRSSCSSQRTRDHDRHRPLDNVLWSPRRRSALQGPPMPPCPNHCVLKPPAVRGFHALKYALRFGAGDRRGPSRRPRPRPERMAPRLAPGHQIAAPT